MRDNVSPDKLFDIKHRLKGRVRYTLVGGQCVFDADAEGAHPATGQGIDS